MAKAKKAAVKQEGVKAASKKASKKAPLSLAGDYLEDQVAKEMGTLYEVFAPKKAGRGRPRLIPTERFIAINVARRKFGWTIAQCARNFGVSEKTVQNAMNGNF